MIELLGQPITAALLGAFGGILLGLSARIGRFCTLGAIEDALYGRSMLRLQMWGMAIATAVFGTFLAASLGWINVNQAYYVNIAFSWPAAVIGGLMFGYGMALAGNCSFGAIARLGGGDLRNFVIVVVMGMSAYAALSGPIAPLRAALLPRNPVIEQPDGLAHALSGLTGISVNAIGMGTGLLMIAALLGATQFRKNLFAVFWSIMAGCAVISGWVATTWLNLTGFEPQTIISHSYAAPVGDSIMFAMQGSVRPLTFGIGSVAGVWAGALLGSIIKRQFRWEACDCPRELRRQIIGAALMGVGAVIAMGCTIGQGISAISILAFNGPVTLLAIFTGAAFGLRQLIEGLGTNPT